MATLWMAGYYGNVNQTEIHYFTSVSAVGFAYNSSAWPNNILKDSTSRWMSITTGLTNSETKSRGLNCMSFDAGYAKFAYSSGSTGAAITRESAIDGSGWDSGSPKAWQCFRVHFEHDSNVEADPAQVWISSVTEGTEYYHFASVWVMEASATGSQNWQAATPGDKMTMTPMNDDATAHSWYIGISVAPRSDAVGFNDDGYIQFSITYF